MHLLPGLLILLLAAAPCSAAPDLDPYEGEWKGNVSISPKNCLWEVEASVSNRNRGLSGSFTYTGRCAKGVQKGSFTAVPSGKSCFSLVIVVPGRKPLRGKACMDAAGNFVLDTPLVKGGLMLTERRLRADIEALAGPVGASGSLWKDRPDAPVTGGDENGEEGTGKYADDRVSKKEVFIGGY